MKWKAKDAFGLGTGKKHRHQHQQHKSTTASPGVATGSPSSSTAGAAQGSSSNKDASASFIRKKKRHSAPGNMAAPALTTPGGKRSNAGFFDGLGTIRVGLTRTESAPICTPTPRAKRQLISELLEPDSDEEGDGYASASDAVAASPTLRSIISNKSSSGKFFEQEAGKGDAFSSYTPEEKVRAMGRDAAAAVGVAVAAGPSGGRGAL